MTELQKILQILEEAKVNTENVNQQTLVYLTMVAIAEAADQSRRRDPPSALRRPQLIRSVDCFRSNRQLGQRGSLKNPS